MSYQIQVRRDAAADWTSENPTIAEGEFGYETDTGKLKVGDGVTAWTSLGYFGGTDGYAIHDNVDGEIHAVSLKGTPVGADELLIEDSAASWAKKRIAISTLSVAGGDPDAIHDNIDAEINAVAEKTTVVGADLFLIEDSAASNAKKKVQEGTLRNYIDAKRDYGAVGNGVTDDTTAIQNALTAAASAKGVVFLPPGTYVIDYLSIPSGVTLTGAGPGQTVLEKSVLTNPFAVRMWGSKSGSTLTLASNATSPTKTVVLNDASSLAADDWIVIYDTTDQIDTVNLNWEIVQIASKVSNTLTLKNTLINSYTTAASAVVEKITSLIEGACVRDLTIDVIDTSETTTTSAVRLAYAYNCRVSNVLAQGYVWGGIYATSSTACKFVDNICGMPNGEYTSALDRGIFLSLGAHHNVVSNNYLRSNRHGIILDYGASCNSITGNVIHSVIPPTPYSTYITDGINLHGRRTQYNTISGNTISGGIYGITVGEDPFNVIVGNTIRNPTYHGIYVLQRDTERSLHLTIANNYIEGADTSYYGVYILEQNDVEVRGNRIYGPVCAVRAVNCDDVVIAHNNCTVDTVAYAIHVTNSLRPRIESNQIYGNPIRAIYVGSDSGEGTEVAPVTDGIVLNNYSKQSSAHGIALVDAQDFEVRGNRLESVGGYAIFSGTISSTCSGWVISDNWAPAASSGFINTIPTGSILNDNPGVGGEINALAAKTAPYKDDEFIIEDSEASYAKKKVELGDLSSWFNVRHYGATGDGTTDDLTAITAAANAARAAEGTLYFPAGTYRVTDTIHLGRKTGDQVSAKGLVGDPGYASIIKADFSSTVNLDEHVIDWSGALEKVARDIKIITDTGEEPTSGIFLARETSTLTGSRGCFTNVYIEGDFEQACVYDYAIESMSFIGCRFDNSSQTGDSAFICTRDNVRGLDSAALVIATGAQSMTNVHFYECWFNRSDVTGSSTISCLELRRTAVYSLIGCFFNSDSDNHAAIKLIELGAQDQYAAGTIQDPYFHGLFTTCIHLEGTTEQLVVDNPHVDDSQTVFLDMVNAANAPRIRRSRFNHVKGKFDAYTNAASSAHINTDVFIQTESDVDLRGLASAVEATIIMPSTATLQLASSGMEGKVVNYDTGLVKYYGAQQMLGESQYLLTCYNNTGGGLVKGDLCYIDGDQSGTPRLALADADAASTCTGALVMANETIGSASSGECVVFGWVSGLSSLTAGAKQYVSTTGGDITETAPSGTGDIVRVVGYAMSTTEIFFNPGGSWVEIT